MTTNRAYTTIEQSRKLAEILPIESADMYYAITYTDAECNRHYNTPARIKQEYSATYETDIPCWSLAALLDVLPNGIVINKDAKNGKYHVSSTHIGTYIRTDNLVDACYEMILKLYELKML